MEVELDETRLPLRPEVAGVCELLGLDPLYLANEDRLFHFCPADRAEAVVTALRSVPHGEGACVIGKMMAAPEGRVTLCTAFGGSRLVDMLIGGQLARIC